MSVKNEDTIRCEVSIQVGMDDNGNVIYDTFDDYLYQYQIDDYIDRGYTVVTI